MAESEAENSSNQLEKEYPPHSIEEYDEFISEDKVEKEDEDPFDSQYVKLNWYRVIFISLFLSFFVVGITLLVLWLISRNKSYIFNYSPWLFLLECGLLLTFGGCVGTFKQSFSLSYLRNRFLKKDKITGADTKLAIGSSYTYIFAGVLLGLASYFAWLVIR